MIEDWWKANRLEVYLTAVMIALGLVAVVVIVTVQAVLRRRAK